MPTIDELLQNTGSVTQKPISLAPPVPSSNLVNQQTAPYVAPTPLDSLVNTVVNTDPSLDSNKDGPPPLNRAGEILSLTHDPNFSKVHTWEKGLPDEQVKKIKDLITQTVYSDKLKAAPGGPIEPDFEEKLKATGAPLYPEEIPTIVQRRKDFINYETNSSFVSGAIRQTTSLLRAPGNIAVALKEAQSGPFTPSAENPGTSILYGANKALNWIDENLLPAKPQDLPWYADLPENIGGSVAFLAGGEAAAPLKLGEAGTTATLGALAGGSQQYEEAQSMGADPNQALLALAGGALFGTTEAVDGGIFLKKLNAASSGKLLQTIKSFNSTKEPGLLGDTIKGFLLEGAQEGAQTVGQNWVASDLAGYDPTRTLGENFWGSVLTGGTVGSMFAYGINKIRAGNRGAIFDQFEKDRQAKLNSGDPINDLGGPVTPIDDLLALRQMKASIEEKMQQEADKIFADKEASLGAEITPELTRTLVQQQFQENVRPQNETDFIAPKNQVPGNLGVDTKIKVDNRFSKIAELPIDTTVEKGLPKKLDGAPLSVQEALDITPVVAVETNSYKETLDIVNANIKKLELEQEAILKGTKLPDENTPNFEGALKALNRSKEGLEKKIGIVKDLVGEIKSYSAAFREAINPDLRLVITDRPQEGQKATIKGTFNLIDNVRLPSGKVVPVGIIYIGIDPLVTQTYYNKELKLPNLKEEQTRGVFETLNHELGHSVATLHMRRLYQTALNGVGEERIQAYKGILQLQNSYETWLTEAAVSKPAQDFLAQTLFSPERVKSLLQAQEKNPNAFTDKYKNYVFSFDEFFAEQTARLATTGALADPVMTKFFTPVVEQYKRIFEKYPQLAQNEYGNNWLDFLKSRMLSSKIQEQIAASSSGGGKDFIDAIRGKIAGFNPENFSGYREQLDHWSKGLDLGFNLLQMEKEFPHIPHWKNYRMAVEKWANYKRNFEADTVDTIKKWRGLARAQASVLSDIFIEEALNKKQYAPDYITKTLNGEQLEVYQEVRGLLTKVLEEMRATAIQDTQRSLVGNQEALKAELDSINKDFDKMKERGYFPFIRFGKYTITATAKMDLVFNGETYKKGQLVTFPTFESQRERDLTINELRKELGDKANVASSVMSETDQAIQGMPRAMLRALRAKLESAGNFTAEQRSAFDKAMSDAIPFRSFRRQFLRKKNIHGYSEDTMRSFASYISSAAGHISRVKYADSIRESILGMQEDVEALKILGRRADERQNMKHWLDQHFDYIMNPGNEFSALRGAGFVAFLGFNVKSAFVNLTQVLTTTYPYLAARYGDLSSIKELSKASLTLKDWVINKKKYIDMLDKGVDNSQTRIAKLFAQGLHEGWIDQSLATELAIARSENNLDRGLFLGKGKRFWHEASRYSALPFHLVEKLNRYVTAVAAHELEYNTSGDHTKAIEAAKQANWSTHYENARWNRPKFMRGKKSAFFLFTNYVQNTLHFATHDPGATRYFMMMLMLAGLAGLPGAEDMEDLVDFTVTGLNRMLGISNPKVAIRQELRKAVEDLGANPDLVLHGLAQDSFGLGQIGELTGIPIPHFDLSGSVGMGNILPFTDIPKQIQSGADSGQVIEKIAAEASGAGGNLVDTFYKGLFSKSPDDWKNMEKIIPLMSMKNISKAARMEVRGGEFTQGGQPVATFDPYDMRDMLELVGQGLGFTPTKVSQGWEKIIAQKDMIQYYKTQSEALLKQLEWSILQEDRESEKTVWEQIDKYNEQVPYPEMGLRKVKDLKKAILTSLKNRMLNEEGIEAQKKYRRIREKLEETYPDPYGKEIKNLPGFDQKP